MRLDREAFSALVKIVAFLVVTGFTTFLLMTILANGLFRSDTEYSAVFRDVTGVAKGDDVRIAGVAVGRVEKVEVIDGTRALVTFGVDSDRPLTDNTFATMKFRNLVGQRYLALSQGAEGDASVLEPGSTIPEDRTKDALDLNVLLNGFKPVFEALSPADTNKLAFELVQTLQGEGSNVAALLARTASLTSTLADRDQLIGDVLVNLSTTLDIVGQRDAELSQTIVTLQQFVSGLNTDRDAILGSLDSISDLATETAGLLDEGRPALVADIQQLDALTTTLTRGDNLGQLEREIQILPIKVTKLANSASFGSQFNFFLCDANLSVVAPNGDTVIDLQSLGLPQIGGARCGRTPLGGDS
ncbi:virulence factor Mce family protein [Aeromicrobium marinum DSM 15272]|uniref:Virulence factor Mce family protein n=1 Tax=Aeromicrobium marinum DSM 15272 TaxID=585531 RepID=E2SGB2_9ACTN|nr:MlaD family protein [Aeromicrobium marinum]EFQ81869.1 virulence factor Mce family protein [Aeromicrobium marinum DSM 15272]